MAIKFKDILEKENVAEILSDDELARIGLRIRNDFEDDIRSRQGWAETMSNGLDLALQVSETKTFPWSGASNVKFPLITIAALQFNSRAYPALLPDNTVVKTKIVGMQNEEKNARAKRISDHMSYQILEEDEAWEEEMDRLLITLPIVGCSFKKTYFDPDKGHNCSVHVLAKDFVVDYWAKSIDTAERKTHRFYLRKNKVTERKRSGYYLDITLGPAQKHTDIFEEHKQAAQQVLPGEGEPEREMLEQHCYLDLDDDDYDEPYIITVDRSSGKVVRLIKRFEKDAVEYTGNQISKITSTEHFTKYGFIPSPDGGFYDLGFGALLGPLSNSIDTTINQLIDSGTMNNLQAGFLGRGIKMKRGDSNFRPGEWKNVNMSGEDIRKNILPLPVKDPSQVLFQLLGLLIEYAERVSSVSDVMAGQSPGQNQPATTTMAVLEQGMKVFSGIFKRIHRCMRDEFRKLYRMNQIYLDPQSEYYRNDAVQKIFQADYRDQYEIKPASDATMASDSITAMQAEAVAGRAAQIPGYNIYEVEKRLLTALKVDNIEQVFPDPKGENAIKQQPSEKMLKLQLEQDKATTSFMHDMTKLLLEAAKTEAEITRLEADSILLLAKAESEEIGPQMDIYKGQLEIMKEGRERLSKMVEGMMQNEQQGMAGMEGAPPQ